MPLGIEGFTYADLYDPAKLRDLLAAFDGWFGETAPGPRAQFEAYRASKGKGMTPLQQSEAILAAAPFVGRFVGKLFGVEPELERFREDVRKNDPIGASVRTSRRSESCAPTRGRAGRSGRRWRATPPRPRFRR